MDNLLRDVDDKLTFDQYVVSDYWIGSESETGTPFRESFGSGETESSAGTGDQCDAARQARVVAHQTRVLEPQRHHARSRQGGKVHHLVGLDLRQGVGDRIAEGESAFNSEAKKNRRGSIR